METLSTQVFIDTNIIIEYIPLAEWDWIEVLGAKPDIYVSLPVVRELDSFKKHVSTGKRKRAKSFIKLMSEVPRHQLHDFGTFRLGIRLHTPIPNARAAARLPIPESRDEELLDYAACMFQFSSGRNFVLSGDTTVVLMATNLLGQMHCSGVLAPAKYRLNPDPDE